MQKLLVASYSFTCSVYLWLLIWLFVRGLTRTLSQRAFAIWILFLALASMSGTIWFSSANPDTALLLSKINFTVLVLGALSLWLFSILFQRDAKTIDILTFVPAILIVPLVWTVMVDSVKFSDYGYAAVTTGWFIPYIVIIFAYYLASSIRIFQVLTAVKNARRQTSLWRIRLLFWSVLSLTVLGVLMPISCGLLEYTWLESIIVITMAIPPFLIAVSFYMGDD